MDTVRILDALALAFEDDPAMFAFDALDTDLAGIVPAWLTFATDDSLVDALETDLAPARVRLPPPPGGGGGWLLDMAGALTFEADRRVLTESGLLVFDTADLDRLRFDDGTLTVAAGTFSS